MNKAINIIDKIRQLFAEQMLFPTSMRLRPMNFSESNLYATTNFPNSDPACIGTFLNVTWVVILDYFGVHIQSMSDPSQSYLASYRARSAQELATVYAHTLDTLVSLTTQAQLYDNDFLRKHGFSSVNKGNYKYDQKTNQ